MRFGISEARHRYIWMAKNSRRKSAHENRLEQQDRLPLNNIPKFDKAKTKL